MKKQRIHLWLVLLVSVCLLVGCAGNSPTVQPDEYSVATQVGQIPDEFQPVIAKNLFSDITAFDGRLLKAEIFDRDEENKTVSHRVRMMDRYGKEMAAYTCTSDDAYHASTLTATADGGFLFVLGFREYAYSDNSWAGDHGYTSHIIKIDKRGKLQFDTPMERVEGWALRYCFEKDGRYYFFGTIQNPATKVRGVYSRDDVYMAVLDGQGTVLNTRYLGGSDFDSLTAAEIVDGAFVLSICAQSDDLDFEGSNSNGFPVNWVVTVDDDLQITEKKKESGREFFDYRIGEMNGRPVYKNEMQTEDFDAGNITALIDYGDTYLLVSENNTGIYENTPPSVSMTWYYTETVYSMYDPAGKLIFRGSVDSSPDYDAMVEEFYKPRETTE